MTDAQYRCELLCCIEEAKKIMDGAIKYDDTVCEKQMKSRIANLQIQLVKLNNRS